MDHQLQPHEPLDIEEMQKVWLVDERLRLEGFDERTVDFRSTCLVCGLWDDQIEGEVTLQKRDERMHRFLCSNHPLWVFDSSSGALREI